MNFSTDNAKTIILCGCRRLCRFFFLPLSLSFISAAAAAAPTYQDAPCPFDYPYAQCGVAILPENRANGSGTVRLPVIQLGNGGDGSVPAVILGGGGPGGNLALNHASSIATWDNYRQQILGESSQLILIDQRGAGLSQPQLNCPEEKPIFLSLLQQPLSIPEESKKWLLALQQCRQRLHNSGVQVEAYTTAAAADDVEDIRRLLGIDKWHLIGFSYATRLAMEILRRHPHGVASAVLDSPSPYDAQQLEPPYPFAAAVHRINAQCQRQPSCRRHGDVHDNIAKALQRAAQSPLTITTKYNGVTYPLKLSPERLIDLLHFSIYHTTGTAALPFFSRQLAQGDTDNENARFFSYHYLDFYLDESWASMLNWAINCHENRQQKQPPTSLLARYEHTYLQEYLKICHTLWPDAAPPPPIVITNKPLLIINGSYDPATPPAWGRALARRLPNARHLVVAAAHTPSPAIPCLMDSIYSFFQSPSATIADYCSDETLFFY